MDLLIANSASGRQFGGYRGQEVVERRYDASGQGRVTVAKVSVYRPSDSTT
jgi:hypothetical protein